jgi:hypothetical protein
MYNSKFTSSKPLILNNLNNLIVSKPFLTKKKFKLKQSETQKKKIGIIHKKKIPYKPENDNNKKPNAILKQ